MNTTTAKITRKGQASKYIPNMVNIKGYMAQIREVGVGEPIINGGINGNGEGETWEEYESYKEVIQPFANKAICEKHFSIKEVEAFFRGKDIRDVIGTKYESCLIKWGENEGDLIVEDNAQAVKAEQKKREEARLENLERIKNETGFEMIKEWKTYFEDEDGKSPCFHYRIKHIQTGREFEFTDRNIFDFGRVVNPVFPVLGGLLINVESFIKHNPSSFDSEEKKKEYRDSHPTESGSGWSRNWVSEDSKDKRNWIPVDQIELDAHEYIHKYGKASSGIRL